MPANASHAYDKAAFEIKVARMYVQDKLATALIAERLGCSTGKVGDALTACDIPREQIRKTWAW